MEYIKLNRFVDKNHSEISKILQKDVSSLDFLINEIKNAKNKSKKLYEITRNISKVIDYYDEKIKINLNREKLTKECINKLRDTFPDKKISDYQDIFKVIVNKSLELDKGNWNKFYDAISDATKNTDNDKVNSNSLYSLDYDDLTPKRLVEIFQRNLNDEMVEGGTFSFQSDTQEMVGIVNEFVLSQGNKNTVKYLKQGQENDIKISELLKEVNAASLVEPFTFTNDEPTFNRAASGQFDGFILQKNSAKVILDTKNENTNIENDSLFRHYVTAMVIKKKIDETVPSLEKINEKRSTWLNYYTDEDRMKGYLKDFHNLNRTTKKQKGESLSLNDYYIDVDFYNHMESMVKAAETDKLTEVRINTNDGSGNRILDYDVNNSLFGSGKIKTKKGGVILDLNDAKEKLKKLKTSIDHDLKIKDVFINKAEVKVNTEKFQEQILLDVKKEEMLIGTDYLSIKSMISDLNRNTKKGLVELGIFEKENTPDQLGYQEMELIKSKAKKLNLELIYFGSVSNKQSSLSNEYDRDFTNKEYKNKEYRFGLNVLAYANILSSSHKDNFKMSTDASLSFVDVIKLRAVTKKKGDKYDLDLEKVNKKGFLNDVVYITYKSIYESKLIKNDSIDVMENLLNTTNVILSDFLEDYVNEKNDNTKKEINIEDEFNDYMKWRTEKNDDFDLVKTVDSLKYYLTTHSSKIKNGSLIDALDQRLNKVIKNSNNPEMKAVSTKYTVKESKENIQNKKNRRKSELLKVKGL